MTTGQYAQTVTPNTPTWTIGAETFKALNDFDTDQIASTHLKYTL